MPLAILLALGLLTAPLVAFAQPPRRAPVVGVLAPGSATSPTAGPSREAFERGLREAGWLPGQTIRVEYRFAEGSQQHLHELAGELVRRRVDVIVARASPSITAARQATATIPIVMSASGQDPIQLGFVASLARPGGNITGLTLLNQDLYIKHLELLKEVLPQLSRVAVLGSSGASLPPRAAQALEAAARALEVRLQHVDVQASGDIDRAFADIARWGAGGLLVKADPFVLEPNTRRVVGLASKHGIPAIYWLHTYPQAGGLMSYGADLFDIHQRSAVYVDRILRGAQPADLPVEEPSKFSFIVNLKTARALGVTIPPSVIARATEVIQ